MPKSRRHRVLIISSVVIFTIGVGGFLARDALFFAFLYKGSPADWELREIRLQVKNVSDKGVRESALKRCLEIAAENPNSRAELTAYLFVAEQWPTSVTADDAYDNLLRAAETSGIDDWERSLEDVRAGNSSDRWQPLAALLIDRVRRQPDHPKAAELLCEVVILVAPDHDVESPPQEIVKAAELIREHYSARPGIQNFCEVVGGMGNAPAWGRPFEPHVRGIVEVNHDRLVRCSAQLALASIVRSGGIERQDEAELLFEEFLERFDGKTEYHAQSIEHLYRNTAKRILKTMQRHGLGASAPATVGRDLEGKPIALSDYQGKVVLVSFWATWCGPCMKAIPHEKKLLEHFGHEQFAIVGVNGDSEPSVAIKAVSDYGVSWRSFQLRTKDGTSIANEWHVSGWPTFYLLNSDGVIINSWQGLPPQTELRAEIQSLLHQPDPGKNAG